MLLVSHSAPCRCYCAHSGILWLQDEEKSPEEGRLPAATEGEH